MHLDGGHQSVHGEEIELQHIALLQPQVLLDAVQDFVQVHRFLGALAWTRQTSLSPVAVTLSKKC